MLGLLSLRSEPLAGHFPLCPAAKADLDFFKTYVLEQSCPRGASDPCWTECKVRALAQLELKMASVITNDLLHVLRRAGIPREGAAAASSCLAYLAEVDRRESSEFLVSG